MFHEAALASVPRSVTDPVATNRNCVDATLNVLVAARAAGVRRVVDAVVFRIRDTPTLPSNGGNGAQSDQSLCGCQIGRENTCARFTRVYGLETVVLRYFNVFGPYQDPTSHYSGSSLFCRKMLAGEQPTIYGDGEQSRDFTFIENVVKGNLLAASAPAEKVAGKIMNLATGSRITLNQIFSLLAELTGYKGSPAYASRAPAIFAIRLPISGWRGTSRL